MRRSLRVLTVVLAAVSLPACQTTGGSGGGYNANDDDDWDLSRMQQLALKDGCKARYGGVKDKLRDCLNMEDDRLVELALKDGCKSRYGNTPSKYRECMAFDGNGSGAGYSAAGAGAAAASSSKPSLNRLQELALADGCRARYNQVPSKLRDCLNQNDSRLVELALTDGCRIRYNGVSDKYRECMRFK